MRACIAAAAAAHFDALFLGHGTAPHSVAPAGAVPDSGAPRAASGCTFADDGQRESRWRGAQSARVNSTVIAMGNELRDGGCSSGDGPPLQDWERRVLGKVGAAGNHVPAFAVFLQWAATSLLTANSATPSCAKLDLTYVWLSFSQLS